MAEQLRCSAPRGRVALGVIVAAVMILGVGAAVYMLRDRLFGEPTQVVIRNASGNTMSLAELVMKHPDGAVTSERFGDLPPGEQRAFDTLGLDFTARLTFVMGGREYVHEDTVDLWRGETFVFEIQPDGSVQAGHDYGAPGGD